MRSQTILLAAVVLVAGWATAQAIVCRPGICDLVRCNLESEENCLARNGKIDPVGGFCGCCAACIVELGLGEKCPFTGIIGGTPPTVRCAENLICHPNQRVCVTLESLIEA